MADVRENAMRVKVFGVRPYVVPEIRLRRRRCVATLVGMAYLLARGGANPRSRRRVLHASAVVMVSAGRGGRQGERCSAASYYTLPTSGPPVLASLVADHVAPGGLRVH